MKTVFVRVLVVLLGLGSVVALAQNVVKADQGRPGNQGPWPVSITGGITLVLDGGLTIGPITQGPSRDGGTDWPMLAKQNGSWTLTSLLVDGGWITVTQTQGSGQGGPIDGGSVTAGQGPSRDGGQTWIVETSQTSCFSATESVTDAGTSAVACPGTRSAGSCFITLCNSVENTGSPQVRIRVDGTAPSATVGSPGQVLGVGSCVSYALSSNVVPRCIATVAGTYVTSTECACP